MGDKEYLFLLTYCYSVSDYDYPIVGYKVKFVIVNIVKVTNLIGIVPSFLRSIDEQSLDLIK